MRDGVTGYIPGSVWVPWSTTVRAEPRTQRLSSSLLRRFLTPKRLSLYQCCLALHIAGASRTDEDARF